VFEVGFRVAEKPANPEARIDMACNTISATTVYSYPSVIRLTSTDASIQSIILIRGSALSGIFDTAERSVVCTVPAAVFDQVRQHCPSPGTNVTLTICYVDPTGPTDTHLAITSVSVPATVTTRALMKHAPLDCEPQHPHQEHVVIPATSANSPAAPAIHIHIHNHGMGGGMGGGCCCGSDECDE
jgi:hypothetical protein